jgi:PIN domain nuclease of toxin-antitoxin system
VKLLLDTHAFLWFVTGDRRLSRTARAALDAESAELYLSAASVWEMAIKSSLARLILPAPLTDYVAEKLAEGFRVLPVDWKHTAIVERLPFHHRDPFDRLLAAQALVERMPIVSRDRVFQRYGVSVVW